MMHCNKRVKCAMRIATRVPTGIAMWDQSLIKNISYSLSLEDSLAGTHFNVTFLHLLPHCITAYIWMYIKVATTGDWTNGHASTRMRYNYYTKRSFARDMVPCIYQPFSTFLRLREFFPSLPTGNPLSWNTEILASILKQIRFGYISTSYALIYKT